MRRTPPTSAHTVSATWWRRGGGQGHLVQPVCSALGGCGCVFQSCLRSHDSRLLISRGKLNQPVLTVAFLANSEENYEDDAGGGKTRVRSYGKEKGSNGLISSRIASLRQRENFARPREDFAAVKPSFNIVCADPAQISIASKKSSYAA